LINSYIEHYIRPNEYIFTYPWGYYSYFTGRRSAIDFHDAAYGIASERDTKLALKQLEERKPLLTIINTLLTIINTLNSGVQIGAVRGDTPNQISWRTEDSPLFSGNGNPIQLYILENYSLYKKSSQRGYSQPDIMAYRRQPFIFWKREPNTTLYFRELQPI